MSKEPLSFIPSPTSAGQRLDKWLAGERQASREAVKAHIKAGRVTLAGKPLKPNHIVKAGESYRVDPLPPPPPSALVPEDIPLDIIYEDKALCVINKPAGMVVHPGAGNPRGTLANAVAHRFKKLSTVGGPLRPGIVHRLDKDTSGLLLLAKTNAAHRALARQLADRTMSRTYWALVWGRPEEGEGRIEKNLGRHPRDRKKFAVTDNGRPALTFYRVTRTWEFASELVVNLGTGRTHQIRVHLASLRHPVVGDGVYGAAGPGSVPPLHRERAAALRKAACRPCLHARELKFIHPATKKEIRFSAPLPPDLETVLRVLGNPP